MHFSRVHSSHIESYVSDNSPVNRELLYNALTVSTSLCDLCNGKFLAGLTKSTCDMRGFRHVTAMADYALRIREQLSYVNEHSFNNFRIRIG